MSLYAVSGSSGLIGSALTAALEAEGHEVRRMVRREQAPGSGEIRYDPLAGRIEAEKLEGLDGLVHLAGENVAAGRWTAARKERIRESRVKGTRLIAGTLAGLRKPPKLLLNASAIGYYGDRGEELLTEDSPPGKDFLAEVCRAHVSRTIAREVWNRYFAPVMGERDVPLLAIYSHIIHSFLYVPDYPLGHLIAFQLEEHFRDADFGTEFERVCQQGRVTPDQWMVGAVGEPLSTRPLVNAASRALTRLQ